MDLFSLVKTWVMIHIQRAMVLGQYFGKDKGRADSKTSDEGLWCRKQKQLNFDLQLNVEANKAVAICGCINDGVMSGNNPASL